ncbi:TetR family transcriptional regulator [Actinospica sp. MGRD01-02]|uniref:TetR family transcriptional regulator n=1 Tax=Actinospica acidithermotolerans TaxID=2828514 RepID=A0A941EB47_9ACTN|nr:TetR family transcriptional regulator [Actinospica acidithermotolerans]MBR7828261.1 TetR family transcriptional regulator [Actinospica acidithermotolerans]
MSRWKPDAAGRLAKAAIELFAEQGYEATTVAEIAERAGLTKRTFFRYYADKREVLFGGAQELENCWLAGMDAAPEDADPMAVVAAGFGPISDLFADRHPFARLRAGIVAENPDLQERELIKLHRLTGVLQHALAKRGVSDHAAALAAQAGVAVFHVAFGRWTRREAPTSLGALMDDSLDELRSVVTATATATT